MARTTEKEKESKRDVDVSLHNRINASETPRGRNDAGPERCREKGHGSRESPEVSRQEQTNHSSQLQAKNTAEQPSHKVWDYWKEGRVAPKRHSGEKGEGES
ncbi:hypothetical protein NDU88_004916 [Pleurodeles waltl]|uniref:Uncharacterized protein n=1 Tax=Pleurodeles waltl TaxID=8319 RepID=A0AAV7VL73_PLEWA|nr:hypothetical protein NDU88_004916 [Pleurodeles waltl]